MIGVREEILNILNKDPKDVTEQDKATLMKAMGETDVQGMMLRTEFAQTQGPLLRDAMSEQAFIESIFRPEQEGDEQTSYPIRSKKSRSAWYSSGTDSVPQRLTEQKEVQFNTFWLESGAKWKLDWLKAGNAGKVQRQLDDMIDDLAYKVNFEGISLIKWAEKAGDFASIAVNTGFYGSGAVFSLDVLEAIMTYVEKRSDGESTLTDVFLSVSQYNQIVKMSNFVSAGTAGDRTSLPEMTRQKLLDGGIEGVASIFLPNFGVTLHKIKRSEFVTDLKCYAFDRNRFGVMPIKKRLETMADNVGATRFETGVIGRQRQGFGITDVDAGVVYYFHASPHTGDTIYAAASSSPAYTI